MGKSCLLGVGLWFLDCLLLGLGEGGVEAGDDHLPSLDYQQQLVPSLPGAVIDLIHAIIFDHVCMTRNVVNAFVERIHAELE